MGYPHSQLKQTATYWPPTGFDKFNDPTFATPVALSPSNTTNWGVRWEDKVQKFINNKGDETHTKSVVYSIYEFEAGGYLFLGVSTEVDPDNVSGADQILQVGCVPNLRRPTKTLYRSML